MIARLTHPVVLDDAALDKLLPMHVQISPTGHIRHAGPTLVKLAGEAVVGRRFCEVFELRRPAAESLAEMLEGAPDGRLALSLKSDMHLPLKGIWQPTGDGYVVNLSFGMSSVEAVAQNDLGAADFAVTDLTVEMLFLAEARSAVMREALKLNKRLRDAQKTAEHMAMSDTLTGLGNRRAMDEALARMIARKMRFSLMHIDLDYFKAVNDTMGHAAGDAVLVEVARVLRGATREEDIVARVGGDEFLILFPGLTETARLADIGHRIILGLEVPVEFQDKICRISGSIGITTTQMYEKPDIDRMLSDVDAALYSAKHAGRATVTIHGKAPEPVRRG